jgi:hypothetical protein
MKKILKWVGGIIVVLIVLGIVAGGDKKPGDAAPGQQAKEEVVALPVVTAADIAAAYHENTVAADQRFKGKKFKVSGVVGDINTDIMGDPYVTLRGGVNQFMEPQFSFDKSAASDLAKLKKGAKVTLTCVGRGDIAKTPMSDKCSLN